MKLGNLLIAGATLLLSFTSSAQDDPDRECKRMKFLAGEAVDREDFAEAASYYYLGELECGNYGAKDYERLIGSLINAMNTASETDEAVAELYRDSLLSAWERQEAGGFYEESSDFDRGINMIQVENPNRRAAGVLLRRGIAVTGAATIEGYLSYTYYNTYMIYYDASEDESDSLKKQMISDYFEYSDLVTQGNMSVQTQESLTSYLNYVVQTAADITPEIPQFISSLPEDVDAAKVKLKNMLDLLEAKDGTRTPEFEMLVDKMIDLDPTSIEALEAKAVLLEAQKKRSEANAVYKKIRSLTDDADQKQEMSYKITYNLFIMGSYSAAYNAAMAIGGKYKGDALVIASDCVAKRAMSCGASTFDRKCNYLYASRLASQAQANGGKVGNRVANYKNSGPTDKEIFDEAHTGSVSLTCYGVSVTP